MGTREHAVGAAVVTLDEPEERAAQESIETTLVWIAQRLEPGAGVSEATRAELVSVRQLLVEGCRERGLELEDRRA